MSWVNRVPREDAYTCLDKGRLPDALIAHCTFYPSINLRVVMYLKYLQDYFQWNYRHYFSQKLYRTTFRFPRLCVSSAGVAISIYSFRAFAIVLPGFSWVVWPVSCFLYGGMSSRFCPTSYEIFGWACVAWYALTSLVHFYRKHGCTPPSTLNTARFPHAILAGILHKKHT